MKVLGVYANVEKLAAIEVLARFRRAADAKGVNLVALGETSRLLPSCPSATMSQASERVEAVVVFGGDGTMLAAVRELRGQALPLMGVNTGSLGFMTSLPGERAEEAVAALAEGQVTHTERTLVEAAVEREGQVTATYCALNDVVLNRGFSSRLIRLEVQVDGVEVNDYACDGLIISTPTGSTGHSLSAGGPIVMPLAPVLVLSLICPHTLSSRPLVVPDTCEVAVSMHPGESGGLLSMDGQVEVELVPGDVVRVSRCAAPVTFLHLPDFDYWEVLRRKLHWRGRVAPVT
jgi:NAD+ kinase